MQHEGDQIQPERSKEEKFLCPSCYSHDIEHVIRAGNFPVVRCHNCKDTVMEEDLLRCDTFKDKAENA